MAILHNCDCVGYQLKVSAGWDGCVLGVRLGMWRREGGVGGGGVGYGGLLMKSGR